MQVLERVLAGFEDLIRGALVKQGAPDAANRQKVYASARQALERMLSTNEAMTPEISVAQRKKLEAAIVEIEKSYSASETQRTVEPPSSPPPPAASPSPPVPPVPPREPPNASEPPIPLVASPEPAPPPVIPNPSPEVPKPARREPSFDDSNVEAAPAVSPVPLDQAAASRKPSPHKPRDYQGDVLNERKPYAKLLLWTIILVGLAVAIWWAITFGPGLLREKFDGSVPNPQPTFESGAFVPGEGDKDGWISVFIPDVNAADIVTNGNGAAELQRDGARSVMRMASPDQATESNIFVRVPRGVMKDLQGQAATLEVTVKSTNDESQEFVIYCQFEAMGNCGRKRFVMTSNPEPFLFDILVNDVFLDEGQDAYLAINTDFSGQGRALDLYSVRVRIGS